MTKIYNKLGSIIIEEQGKDKLYLNPDDVRLAVSGEVFQIIDAQVNRYYQLGAYTAIVDGTGQPFPDKDACETYLLTTISSSTSGGGGEDGGAEPEYTRKLVQETADGSFTKITWYDATDTLIKTQTISIDGGTDPGDGNYDSETEIINS